MCEGTHYLTEKKNDIKVVQIKSHIKCGTI